MIPFVKMHGCGNDFVVVRDADLEGLNLEARAHADFVRAVCDRHFGVGADGLLAYGSGRGGDRLRMRYWNRDGTRAEMCGNGARCVVRLGFERGETTSPLKLETDTGTLDASVEVRDDVYMVEIRMERVRWDAASVGMDAEGELVDAPLRMHDTELRVTALSVGNPHAVVFVRDAEALRALPLETLGAALATHPRFRHGANASFVFPEAETLRVRVWERGSGATLACGTAACAVVAAAARLGHLDAPRARVRLPGGEVEVRLDAEGHAWLRGPAVRVAEGRLDASLLPPALD